jgi:ABC-2 type transport system ATP-binding protein
MTTIEMCRLGKAFGPVRAVRDLTFTVRPGRVTGFLGPNGAGKSTTIRMLLGLVRPDSGDAIIDGRRYSDLPRPAETVGAVLENAAFHRGLTARRMLRAHCVAAGLDPARVDEVLADTDLTDAADRRIRGYSLGMRQRLALARALLGRPGALVLDEPANGLDPEGIRWLRGKLRDFAGAGHTVLVSSHVLAEVEQVADDVVVIADGRLLGAGPIAGVLAATGASTLEDAYLSLRGGMS